MSTSFLKVSGSKIVNDKDEEVILRGAGLGGWMNMENFISGYPGCEYQIREALEAAIGKEKSEFFFNKFLEYFFTDDDARLFKSLGLNCIRLPFNYRHFEDDMNPLVLKKEGFKHLDRVIDICAKHQIYTILDMHTAPGGQNTDWHCDSGIHIAAFWQHADFQNRSLWLWDELSKYYANNPWIVGYNPLNEPTAEKVTLLTSFYQKVHDVIRKNDTKHILFWDGNTFASDFTAFGDAWKGWTNSAFSVHDYTAYGFPGSEVYTGSDTQRGRLVRNFERKQQWLVDRGLCVWNGEWGPVYARKEYDGAETKEINKVRYKVLADQLDLYQKHRLSWSIWLWKDIGFQGMVYVSHETPYMKLLADFLAKKHRLAADAWGADTKDIQHIYEPLEKLVDQSVALEEDKQLYPWPVWKMESRVGRLSRNILVSEYLVREWARHFVGKSEVELDEIAKSFLLKNCLKRDGLNKALSDHAASM